MMSDGVLFCEPSCNGKISKFLFTRKVGKFQATSKMNRKESGIYIEFNVFTKLLLKFSVLVRIIQRSTTITCSWDPYACTSFTVDR